MLWVAPLIVDARCSWKYSRSSRTTILVCPRRFQLLEADRRTSQTPVKPRCQSTSVYSEANMHYGDSPQIQVLPRNVVSRIAAGEVIDGLCALVRELVENALDASATNIIVDVDPCAKSVAVYDDGVGISLKEGLLKMATCNATSKIRTAEDLATLKSLGFRGQGLWAIAMHARQLSVSSRPSAADIGTRTCFSSDGAAIESSVVFVAMAPGTVVLASAVDKVDFSAADMRDCKNWIMLAALCHPRIAFNFKRSSKSQWSSTGWSGKPSSYTFSSLLGKSRFDFRHSSVHDSAIGSLEITVGLPSRVHFASASRIIVAVNGRCVELRSLKNLIRDEFRSSLPKGRYPAIFAHFRVTKPGACDWNLHPMKQTMRLGSKADPCDVSILVRRAIEAALRFNEGDEPGSYGSGNKLLTSILSDAAKAAAISKMEGSKGTGLESGLFGLTAVAQVLKTYILGEYNDGILLIEQHVAHERILFERLRVAWASAFVPLPRKVLLPRLISSSDDHLFALTSLGFGIEVQDEQTEDAVPRRAYVRTVPENISLSGHAEIIDILIALSVGKNGREANIDDASATVACRTAVKNGMPLSSKQMRSIVHDLVRCQNPHTCPHGRPVFLELKEKDLASVFQRSWTIQKGARKADNPGGRGASWGVLRENPEG